MTPVAPDFDARLAAGTGKATAYYNEIDPFAAKWLRNLISAGEIAAGDVDERSIVDVKADELAGYTQCHFFAGIGGWSLALRLAGWPDDEPVWTGSCPCQPFSNSGEQKGTEDHRDLWPVFFRLISIKKPPILFGEQVKGAIPHGWIDRTCDDMESENYAIGSSVLPAFGYGASFEGYRIYFVAKAAGERLSRPRQHIQPFNSETNAFGEANSFINAFQKNALPYVCPKHDGISTKLAHIALHGAGNAIVPQVAAEFIRAYMEVVA